MPAIAASATSMQDHPSAPFIAADVGGTHVRLGLVQAGAEGAPPQVLAYSKYRCADHPGLHAILDDFRFPGTDPEVRARLEAELEVLGPVAMHERLAGLESGLNHDVEKS